VTVIVGRGCVGWGAGAGVTACACREEGMVRLTPVTSATALTDDRRNMMQYSKTDTERSGAARPRDGHRLCGGARERCDLVCGLATSSATASGAMRSPAAGANAIAISGGGGKAAINIRHPVQQLSRQVLSVPPSGKWPGLPARSEWQMIPPGCAPAAAAICAPPRLAMRPASATV
jgi:hypothetical protein